jgi:hypothetical protein
VSDGSLLSASMRPGCVYAKCAKGTATSEHSAKNPHGEPIYSANAVRSIPVRHLTEPFKGPFVLLGKGLAGLTLNFPQTTALQLDTRR